MQSNGHNGESLERKRGRERGRQRNRGMKRATISQKSSAKLYCLLIYQLISGMREEHNNGLQEFSLSCSPSLSSPPSHCLTLSSLPQLCLPLSPLSAVSDSSLSLRDPYLPLRHLASSERCISREMTACRICTVIWLLLQAPATLHATSSGQCIGGLLLVIEGIRNQETDETVGGQLKRGKV